GPRAGASAGPRSPAHGLCSRGGSIHMCSQRLVLTVFVCLGPALAAVAAPPESRTVSPSGGDDTAAVQAALDDCPPGCVVALEAGTFRIAQLVASDFRGEVRGQGRGVTV